MRQETIVKNIYTFDELNEEQKQKAINNLYDINIDYDWWDYINCDLDMLKCKLLEFDIDRGSYCKIDFSKTYVKDVANAILEHHGELCETYKMASKLLKELNSCTEDEDCDDCLEHEKEFIHFLQEEYLSMLRREYEYLTSEESIVETIRANEYEFYEDGKLA